VIDGEVDFATKRYIINLLDIKVKLAVEDGQHVVYASCVLDTNVQLELLFYCTNLRFGISRAHSQVLLQARIVV